jgi:hypothetical protein
MGEVFKVALNEGNVPEKLTRRYHHAYIDRNQYQWLDGKCRELTIGRLSVTGGMQRGLFQNKPALLVRGLFAAYT